MVDFLNANLCGASPELNDVLSKLEDAKADITAKLDVSASAASAAFGEAKNELEGLKNKLQTIEIPAIPKLNLQAEIASLTSLVPGTPSFLSALAKVKLEFEDDIKGAGLDLGTLVADATTAITGGGDLCALVPNLEKTSGSLDAATTKPAAVTQAAAKAISEASSVIQQNANILKRVERNASKKLSYEVTNTPLTEDTGALKIITEAKKISTPTGIVKTAPLGTGKNVASGAGFPNKKTRGGFFIPAKDITDLGKDGTFVSPSSGTVWNTLKTTLAHEPVGQIYIMIHPPAEVRDKLLHDPGPYTIEQRERVEVYLGRTFGSRYGPHMFEFISTTGKGTMGNLYVKVSGKEIKFASVFSSVVDHPGNIDSGGNNADTPNDFYDKEQIESGGSGVGESLDGPETFRAYGYYPPSVADGKRVFGPGIFKSDTKLNTLFKGAAVHISYDYLDNYDADVAT